MTRTTKLSTWLLGALCAVTFSPAAHAEDPTVKVMVGGVQKVVYLPAKLADQLGYYKDAGLNVEITNVTTGSISETALLSGSADAVVGAYEQTQHLQARGKFVTTIAQISATPQEVLIVSNKSNIKTVADLKGKVIGVTGFGSLTHFLGQDLLARVGLKNGDANYVAVGAGNTFISALQQGRIDAGIGTDPDISIAERDNLAHVLVDMRKPDVSRQSLGGDYPGASLYVRYEWIQQHPDLAKKLAGAISRTLKFIASHSAEEIADKMPPDYYRGDKALYVSTIAHGKPSFTPDGKMPADGPTTVMNILAQFTTDIDPKKMDMSKTYTNEFAG